jgi:hypothetical protein
MVTHTHETQNNRGADMINRQLELLLLVIHFDRPIDRQIDKNKQIQW